MSDEGFLRRWARRKTEVQDGLAEAAAPAPQPVSEPGVSLLAEPLADAPALAPGPAPAPAPALPTMDDVASLGADSDFSAFVARGVDQAVRRGALKKLFADPHFNVMDKLDIYIDDYTKPSPVSAAMLASLSHAKSVFMRVLEDEEGVPPEAVEAALAEPEAQAAPQEEPTAHIQQPPEQETQ